jgi:hypothetical protein
MERLRSIKQTSTHGILFLQGVFKKDCKRIEDMFQDKLMSEGVKPQETKVYDKIPVIFTSVNDWIKSTNILCWYCSRSFKNRPWFEPQSIEPISEISNGRIIDSHELKKCVNRKALSIVVNGIFCTCNCVRAYINTHTKDMSDKLNKIAMLIYVYEIFTGKSIPDIQPSPPPIEMIQYGGALTAIEYQQKIDSLDVSYQRELDDNNFASICSMYIRTLNIEKFD